MIFLLVGIRVHFQHYGKCFLAHDSFRSGAFNNCRRTGGGWFLTTKKAGVKRDRSKGNGHDSGEI